MTKEKKDKIVNLHLTKEGVFILDEQLSREVVLGLSKNGAPYGRSLEVKSRRGSVQFVVSLPSLKIQDPLNSLSSVLCLDEAEGSYLFEMVGNFGGQGGPHFMSELFSWLKLWNAASGNDLRSLKWTTTGYFWTFSDESTLPIAISSEPVKLAEDGNEVRYICFEITVLNAKRDGELRHKREPDNDENGGSRVLNIGFTKREEEVLLLLRQGMTSREIADLLFVSEHTVKNHRKNMMRKAGVSNVIELLNRTVNLSLGEQ